VSTHNIRNAGSLDIGILYANLESFSIEYQEVRQWGPVVGSLPFIALLIGILCAAAINIYNNKYYGKKLVENGYRAVPEARLPPMMLGGIVFTAGQFLFACELPSQLQHQLLWNFKID
jgi:hypothetical protein